MGYVVESELAGIHVLFINKIQKLQTRPHHLLMRGKPIKYLQLASNSHLPLNLLRFHIFHFLRFFQKNTVVDSQIFDHEIENLVFLIESLDNLLNC